jgi:putative transposase
MSDVRRLPVGGGMRVGARRMIAAVLEAEVEEYVGSFADEVGGDGKRVVVRNGRVQERRA